MTFAAYVRGTVPLKTHVPVAGAARIIRVAMRDAEVSRVLRRRTPPKLRRVFLESFRFIRGGVFEGYINGVKLRFYDPEGPENYWLSFLEKPYYEHSVVLHLAHTAKQFDSPIFLDVGAHYGYFTVYFSKLIGEAGKAFSFEPNHAFLKILSANVKLNEIRNAVLYGIALSDKSGKVTFEASQRWKVMGYADAKRKMRTLDSAVTTSYEEEAVTAEPFDEVARTENISPDIVKVDVHGGEGNVVKGMKEALKRSVSHLYCELHDEMSDGYTSRDVVGMLQDSGMDTYEFQGFRSPKGRLVPVSSDLFLRPGNRMIYARKKI